MLSHVAFCCYHEVDKKGEEILIVNCCADCFDLFLVFDMLKTVVMDVCRRKKTIEEYE